MIDFSSYTVDDYAKLDPRVYSHAMLWLEQECERLSAPSQTFQYFHNTAMNYALVKIAEAKRLGIPLGTGALPERW